jgi:hypothetical protein
MSWVGDDEHQVLLAAAGGADVEAAAGGGFGVTSSTPMVTVSDWLPCSVAA